MLSQLAILLLFCLLSTVLGQQTYTRSDRIKVRNRFAFTADKGLISPFAHQCIDNAQRYKHETKQSPSIETLIELIERLEDVVANTSEFNSFNSPDRVARMILHRFHLDSVDFATVEQDSTVGQAAQIDTAIIGKMTNIVNDEYYFPDSVYNDDELCTMLFMFSHIFLNNTHEQSNNVRRNRRATYQFQRSQSSNSPVNSAFLENQPIRVNQENVGLIQEKGIVSFRLDKTEAIAPAKVLIGIIAGFTDNAVLSGKAISAKLNSEMSVDVTLKDTVLAATFGQMMGTASFFDFGTNNNYDQSLIYGVQGTWVNETCCNYYATAGVTNARLLRKSNRGSLAQIRGALDGYIIGKNLKNIDAKQLRLSTILKTYYSWPHMSTTGNKLGVSYCDRRENRPTSTEIADIGNAYNTIFNYVFSKENSAYKGDLISSYLDKAAGSLQEFCNKRPTGNLDRNSPLETLADLIFIVDPKAEEMSKTADLISQVISRINKIGRHAGAVSVFVNSNSRLTADMPSGPGGWPLPALVWNSTNIGAAVCQLTTETPLSVQTSAGKYLLNVNQTLFNYKWWTRKSYTGVPSKNVILIDYGSLVLPTSGSDLSDFNTYKSQLYWRNRDTRYFAVSPKEEIFKDFIQDKSDIVNPSGQVSSIASTIATKIGENPATLIYNDCLDHTVKNATFEGFVTVGYQQRLALYPEYFKVSSNIEFTIKAVEGGIKFCYDRNSPPEKQENCKELTENAQETFNYYSPCEGHTVHTCRPIYITVWGKERTTPCKDARCLSLDQAKFTINQSGAYCNSSVKLASALLFQIICLVCVWVNSYKSV